MKTGFEPKWLLKRFYVCENFSILGLRLFSGACQILSKQLGFAVVVDVGVYSMGRIRGLVTL